MDPSRKCLRTSDGMHLLTQCLGVRFLGFTVQPNSHRNLLSDSDQILFRPGRQPLLERELRGKAE